MASNVTKAYAHGEMRVDTPVATPPSTPTPTAITAHGLHHEIRSIHQQLSPLKSLAPCELVNNLLTRLVSLCIEPYSTDIVEHFVRIDGVKTLCHDLQSLCATAEGELERHWAQSILTAAPSNTNPARAQNLVPAPPLTSLCLLTHFPTATIHNIDRDARALALSSALTQKLGCAARMTFSCEDATETEKGTTDWAALDVVFLAALVGMRSTEKVGVLRGLARRLRPGTVVVCRSARGMRGVLYPVLELSEELHSAGFEVLAEMHPWTDVVNSVVVLRVKQRV
ncbi:hypothetical protein N0V90_004764 [Kalmusia sp. IMI 367209]|nr:hypothetical protein N0V90_004764 [Kalmusia sp. IMI 367209]